MEYAAFGDACCSVSATIPLCPSAVMFNDSVPGNDAVLPTRKPFPKLVTHISRKLVRIEKIPAYPVVQNG